LIVAHSVNRSNGRVRAVDWIPSDQVGRFNLPANVLNLVSAGAPRGLYPSYNLWMPRFGFAWNVFGDNKTSLRGGFASLKDRVQGNLVFSQSALPPFSGSVSYESGNMASPNGGAASAVGALGSINAIDPNLKVPSVMDY